LQLDSVKSYPFIEAARCVAVGAVWH